VNGLIDIQTIGILLTGLAVSIAAIYYTLTLRYSRRNQDLQLETRQAQLFMQIYDHSFDVEFVRLRQEIENHWKWENSDDYMKKYSVWADTKLSSMWSSLMLYYEGIGVLLNRGLIDATLIDDLMAGAIIRFWEKFGPLIYEWRKSLNRPYLAEWVEYLYNQIKPIIEEQHPEIKTI
jgi:hypothetical protein